MITNRFVLIYNSLLSKQSCISNTAGSHNSNKPAALSSATPFFASEVGMTSPNATLLHTQFTGEQHPLTYTSPMSKLVLSASLIASYVVICRATMYINFCLQNNFLNMKEDNIAMNLYVVKRLSFFLTKIQFKYVGM